MKKTTFTPLLMSLLLLIGCSDTSIEPIPTPTPEPEVNRVYLSFNATLENMQARAIVESFKSGDQIGVFADTQNNVPYVYDGKAWKEETKIEIKQKMDVFAYYPYTTSVTTSEQIPVDVTTQTDYLYGTGSCGIGTPNVSVTMKHALSLVRIVIKKNDYNKEGKVERVAINNIATLATLNAQTGVVNSNNREENASLQIGGNYLLDDKNLVTSEAILVPVGSAEGITASLVIDGEEFTYSFPSEHVWEQGLSYTYTLNMREGYNCPVDMEEVPIDVEYWSVFGKTDNLVIREYGDDLFTVRKNYTKYGYDCYQNEGKIFGAFYSNYTTTDFEGEVRFLLTQNGEIIEQYPPVTVNTVKSGQWGGMQTGMLCASCTRYLPSCATFST